MKKYFLLHFLLYTAVIYAQIRDTRYQVFSIDQGLSSATVNAIVQDSLGFLWFGTEDGLNRFDGKSFDIFRQDPQNKNSLSNNYIWSLEFDAAGNLWIGTEGGGLNIFDPSIGVFNHYPSFTNMVDSSVSSVVQAICRVESGDMYVGTWGSGLFKYIKSLNKFESITYYDKSQGKDLLEKIWCLVEIDGKLWIGTELNGLFSYDPETREVNRELLKIFEIADADRLSVTSLVKSKDEFWIATYGRGLLRYDRSSDKFFRYVYDEKDPSTLGDDIIWKLIEDGHGNIIAGTMSMGLSIYDRESNVFERIVSTDKIPLTISSNHIRSLFEDSSGNLWVGTMLGGVNKINLRPPMFTNITTESEGSGLSNNFVFSLTEMDDGKIWIGTYGSGITIYDPQNDIYEVIKSDQYKKLLGNGIVRSILESDDQIFIGTFFGGLNIFEKQTQKLIQVPFNTGDPNSTSSENIRTLFEDSHGDIWIGTNSGGLNRYEKQTKIFKKYLPNSSDTNSISSDFITAIDEDSIGNLWIGTYTGGINYFDRKTEKFKQYLHSADNKNSVSSNLISDLIIDSKGFVWAATWGGGLNRYEHEFDGFEKYTIGDGLATDVIYSIIEDTHEDLWLSTNRGISKFVRKENQFKNYNSTDGVLPGEFNAGSKLLSSEGRIYFGGANGVCSFLPENVKDNPNIPKLALTSLKIFDDEFESKKSITYLDKVELDYSDYVITFRFAALEFSRPELNRYKYKLEGFDKEWNYSGTRNFATYTNLDPGKYKFLFNGSNNNLVWSEKPAELSIIIKPPIWQTWYFRGALILLLFLSGYSFLRKRINRLKEESRDQQMFSKELIKSQEDERKRIASELHDSLGQELLIIKNRALFGMKEEDKSQLKNQFNEIAESAGSAIEEVRQISYNLHPYQLSTLGLTKALNAMINKIEGTSEIVFSTEITNIDKALNTDSEIQIYRIVQEAINNIVKHSGAGFAGIEIRIVKEGLKIQISDNGKGFNMEEVRLKHSSGLNNIRRRVELLNGRVNFETRIGSGTKIIINIPLN